MTDVVDMATDIVSEHIARGIAAARVPIPAGTAGECDNCGDTFARLVGGLCGYCRDGRRRPMGARAWVLPEKSQANAGDEATAEAAVVEPVSRRETVARVAVTAGENAGGEVSVPASPPFPSSEDGVVAVKRAQLSAWIDVVDKERVRVIAEAADSTMAAVTAELIVEALAARAGGKPMIRAAVIRAAREARQPLPDFVSALITLGLAVHLEREA
ncbi:MAG: hypothetical protein FJ335_02820 [Sphingomonadales bacterium]|nr:hypothetical protein [Sphingomonadales bacterium]